MRDSQDAYGQAMLDHLRGRETWEIVERDDGHFSLGAGPELCFAEFKESIDDASCSAIEPHPAFLGRTGRVG